MDDKMLVGLKRLQEQHADARSTASGLNTLGARGSLEFVACTPHKSCSYTRQRVQEAIVTPASHRGRSDVLYPRLRGRNQSQRLDA